MALASAAPWEAGISLAPLAAMGQPASGRSLDEICVYVYVCACVCVYVYGYVSVCVCMCMGM